MIGKAASARGSAGHAAVLSHSVAFITEFSIPLVKDTVPQHLAVAALQAAAAPVGHCHTLKHHHVFAANSQ